MKKTITVLKASIFCLFLMTGVKVSAQIKPGDKGSLPINGTGTDAIFVYGGTGFTLTASLTSTSEDGVAGEIFNDFTWTYMSESGGGNAVSSLTSATAVVGGSANSELNVTGLAPGFYTFVAQGHTNGEICSADPEEFTVFVLPPLQVTLASTGNLEYCSDDDFSTTAPVLTATTDFDLTTANWNTQTNLSSDNPSVSDFEIRYRWYKVVSGEPFNISSETAFQEVNATNTNTYTLTESGDKNVGKWDYYVAVDYTVKTSGPYETATPVIIEVTPKPGKPTITISANP